MTYLILHRVRGEPAYDIAEKLEQPEDIEDIWIIPTSGHRAYPFQVWNLEDLRDVSDINQFGNNIAPIQYMNALPADWPDHYPMDVGDPPAPSFNALAFVSSMLPKLRRRV